MARLSIYISLPVCMLLVIGCGESDTGGGSSHIRKNIPLEEKVETDGDITIRTQFRRLPDGKTVNHGRCIMTYATGEKAGEGAYENDKERGIWRAWYKNGQLRMEGKYVFGRKDGMWTWWNPEGKVERRERYQHGRKFESPTPSPAAESNSDRAPS